MDCNNIIALFKEKSLRATPQRMAVYKYLCENRTHPDVEQIYTALIKNNPTFSKTTVYNALQSLRDSKLITAVSIDNQRVHYDACTDLHGHFICNTCKKIYDFDIESIESSGIDHFQIEQRDVYYNGICPDCR